MAKTTHSMMTTESKFPTLAGISLPEIAVLGAAGFVLWRNRSKIQSLLEDNGINVPSIFSADLPELIQSGVSLISGDKDVSGRGASTRAPGSRRSSAQHDA
jgi:hypothetical protein